MRKGLAVLLAVLLSSFALAWQARAVLQYVVDGDTVYVLLNGRREKVRLIGIDTPEIHWGGHLYRQARRLHKTYQQTYALGLAAKSALEGLLFTCSSLRLETDVQERDRYGRLLAYLWCDGKLINEEMLRLGYAMVYTFPPNVKYVERFLAAQKEARQKRRGLWK